MIEDRKRTSAKAWVFFAVLVIILGAVASPAVIRAKKQASHAKSVSNTKVIGLALMEFELSFGTFPDQSTASEITKKSGKAPDYAHASANDYFSQLIAAGIVSDDSIFYAETAFTKKPSMWFPKHDASLDPGEVGYGYLLNGKTGLTSAGHPGQPIICAPLAYDGKSVSDRLFDPSIHNGAAIILRRDGSVHSPSHRIDPKTKTLNIGDGKTLLDTGPGTIWGSDTTPIIVPPLPAR